MRNVTDEEKRRAVERAVLRRALGYDAEEVVEEYAGEDGSLVRRKVTRKSVPPDIAAARFLMGEREIRPLEEMTDGELEAEKARLTEMLEKEGGRE